MATPRRRNLMIAGGLGALLVAGGTVAAVLLLGGDDSRLVEGDALRDPVSGQPEETWSWSGTATSAAAVGDVLVLGSESEGDVVALDEDGEELWTSDVGDYAYSVPRYADIVFVTDLAEGEVSALSVDDGEELWTVEGDYVAGSSDDGLVFTDFDEVEVGLLDAETGEEQWSVTSDSYAFTEDAVYALEEGRLSRFAIDTGEEEWSVDTEVESSADYVSVVANDELVVLGDDEAMAFDTGDGGELWSEGMGKRGEVGAYSDSRVYVADSTVTVYDREGPVGELDVDQGAFGFFATQVEADGTTYAFDHSSGGLFDADLAEAARYDGLVTFVDGGLYTLRDDGEVSYFELGSASPEWSIDTPGSTDVETEVALVPLDGRLVVVAEDRVASYQ